MVITATEEAPKDDDTMGIAELDVAAELEETMLRSPIPTPDPTTLYKSLEVPKDKVGNATEAVA